MFTHLFALKPRVCQNLSQNVSPHKCKAFTLLELMTSLSVTSILATIAITNFSDFMIKMRVDNEISQLYRLLLITRNSAINSGQHAILCPLNSNFQCTTQWFNELSVFIDANNNKQFDADEKIIQIKGAIVTGDNLVYGQGRNKVTFKPTGHLSGLANGTFRYCPQNENKNARGIIVARSGRLHKSVDSNHDGIDESRSKKNIHCD